MQKDIYHFFFCPMDLIPIKVICLVVFTGASFWAAIFESPDFWVEDLIDLDWDSEFGAQILEVFDLAKFFGVFLAESFSIEIFVAAATFFFDDLDALGSSTSSS